MSDHRDSGSTESITKWLANQQAGVKPVVDEKPKVKTDRQKLMAELDSRNIEYKKNAKTADLKELLEDN